MKINVTIDVQDSNPNIAEAHKFEDEHSELFDLCKAKGIVLMSKVNFVE